MKIDIAGKSKSEVLDEVFEIMDAFCLEMDDERNYLSYMKRFNVLVCTLMYTEKV